MKPIFRRPVAVCLLACLCLIAGTAPVVADHKSDDEPEPAIFAIPEVWPWGFEDRYGQPDGTLVTFAHRLVAVANLPIAYELRPHRRAISELLEGTVDFVVLFESPLLDKAAIGLGTVVTTQVMLTAMSDSNFELSLDGLAGKPVAFISGTYYGEKFEQATSIRKFPVRDIFQAIEMLKLGRVSAILCSDQALYRTMQSLQLSPDRFRTRVFREGQRGILYMSRRARYPQLEGPIREALQQLERDGDLADIFRLPL
ncbi:substrate-binding periplasmic protein [Marinobacter halodurans]|nr:transporter substrate-binding domain-containing protein [Marinobacter halodurans]